MVSTKISTPKTNKANNYLSNNVINKPKEIFFKFLPFPLENILFVSSLKPSTTCLLYYVSIIYLYIKKIYLSDRFFYNK